jgi:transposase
MWAYKVRNKYGLTIEQYNEMRDSFQSCSICGYSEKLVLDHNHRTGQLREFICSNCNLALGLLNEDPERMERMIAYVRKHEREEIK